MRSCGADGKTMCGSSDEKLENLQAKSTVGGQPASKGNADIFFRNFRRVVLSMARESTPAEETPPEVADSVPGGLFHVTPDVFLGAVFLEEILIQLGMDVSCVSIEQTYR